MLKRPHGTASGASPKRQCWPALRLTWHPAMANASRSEEHTSELQSLRHLVCRLLLEKKKIYVVDAQTQVATCAGGPLVPTASLRARVAATPGCVWQSLM